MEHEEGKKVMREDFSNKEDLIRRQDMIESILFATADGDKADWIIGVIKSVPSVQKTGKWIQAEDIPTEYAVCTNCKGHGEFYMDYCCHCGCRMVGEDDG